MFILVFPHVGMFALMLHILAVLLKRGSLWCFSFWQGMRIQLSGLLGEKVIFVGAQLDI